MFKGTVIFFHIPKTAGTSFTKLLAQVYGLENIYSISGQRHEEDIARFKSFGKEKRDSYRVVTGHRSDKLLDDVKEPAFYIAFLREPIDLALSSYHYIQQTEHNRHHEEVSKLRSFSDFLKWQSCHGFDSMQTRYLAGVDPRTKPAKKNLTQLKGLRAEQVSAAARTMAREIENIYLLENMDEALLDIAKKLGWSTIPDIGMSNRSVRPPTSSLSAAEVSLAQDIHDLDIRLYEEFKSD